MMERDRILEILRPYDFEIDDVAVKYYFELGDLYYVDFPQDIITVVYNKRLTNNVKGALSFRFEKRRFMLHHDIMSFNNIDYPADLASNVLFSMDYSISNFNRSDMLSDMMSYDAMIEYFLDMYLYYVTIKPNLGNAYFYNNDRYKFFSYFEIFRARNNITVTEFWKGFYHSVYVDIYYDRGIKFMKYFIDIDFSVFPTKIQPPKELLDLQCLLIDYYG